MYDLNLATYDEADIKALGIKRWRIKAQDR
jgi:hypothetical protein